MSGIRTTFCFVLAAVTLTMASADAQAPKKQLVVALNQDPDILDPTLSRTYVGRIIFAQMCEKLYEIDESLNIYPQLAAALPAVSDGGKTVTIKLRSGVKFNDGTPFTAEAMKFSLDRHREMKGSNRRSELESVTAVEVVDPLTVRLRLKAPFSPLTAQLADRSGMPISPAADKKLGEKFGTAPVCVGPWQFVERVAQDRIVVERSPHYFDQSAAKFDRIVFRIIPDDNVRLANLRSGDIDVMHMVAPTDATSLKKEGALRGLQRHRAGLQLGQHQPAQQDRQDEPARRSRHAAGQRSRACAKRSSCRSTGRRSTRSPTRARTRSAAGPSRPTASSSTRPASARPATWPGPRSCWPTRGWPSGYKFEMVIINNPPQRRVGEVIQGMAREAGFDISLRPQEFASSLKDNDDGKHQSFLIGWSGRVDPDGNIHQGQACGGSLNATLRLRREDRRAAEQGARGQ